MKSRVVSTVASVLAAAATGVVTNVLSDNWALTWWLALGALVAISVVLQLVITAPTERTSSSGRGAVAVGGSTSAIEPNAPSTRPVGGVVGVVHAGRDSHVAGGDITINHHNPDRGESQLELAAVTLTETGPDGESSAVLDLKLRNIGGQPAILHRATFHIHDAVSLSPYSTLGFMPYFVMWARGVLHVSHTYDIALPTPGQAGGSHHNLDLSQAIEPAGTDRFHIRLGIHGTGTQDTLIYLLHFDLHYDADRTLTSPTIAIAHPPGSRLITLEEIRSDLHDFRQAVREVRDAIDREMIIRGLPAPDWDNHPPTSRADLPANLRSVDGDPRDVLGVRPGTFKVNDIFWNPDGSLARRLHDIHAYYSRVVSIITGADIRHDSLPQILTDAQTILAQLPALHAELSTPEKVISVQETTPSGNLNAANELVQLLGGQHLEELRARANLGDQDAAGQLDTAAGLADKIRQLGPDDPEALDARETLIFWLVSWDKAGAAVALSELVPAQVRIQGPDHPRTLRARHYLAMCRGETGDAAGAAAAFAALVEDRTRVLGPGHPDTLDSRHELARWRVTTGDAAGAAAAFAALVEDRTRIQGPDHRSTLYARHNLAVCRGKAGDAAGAAAALAELLADRIRVLGPDHADTVENQRALARWQDQAGPEGASAG